MSPVKIFIALIFLSFLPSLALTEPTSTNVNPLTASCPDCITCPPIQALRKNPKDMTWWAYNGWRSHSTSFASHINKFLGAQWQGVNVGSITCLYTPNEKTFTIELEYNALVYEPSNGLWSKNLGGYKNCPPPPGPDRPSFSQEIHQTDCAFKPRITRSTDDVYQQASELRSDPQLEKGF